MYADGGPRGTVAARRGISRVAVLVVLGIVVVLGTVVAGGILSARQASRRLQCLCRIRSIGLAVHNYASGNLAALPPLTGPVGIAPGDARPVDGHLTTGWPVFLLPAVDDIAVWRSIQANAVRATTADSAAIYDLSDRDKITLPKMVCPEDSRPTGLSYVMNAGFIAADLYTGDPARRHFPGGLSWDGNSVLYEPADEKIHRSTGVMWHSEATRGVTLDDISNGDGTTTTLMLTENLQAGSWFDTDTARIGFGLSITNTSGRVPFGTGATFESPQRPLNTEFSGGTLLTASPHPWRINQDRSAKPGTRPRPSSNHPPVVSAMMCDASGRIINQKIDPHVYLKLLTWNGAKYGELILQSEF